ncbi:Uncharacterized protein FWK35_00035702, partial [Aphis craccivora]
AKAHTMIDRTVRILNSMIEMRGLNITEVNLDNEEMVFKGIKLFQLHVHKSALRSIQLHASSHISNTSFTIVRTRINLLMTYVWSIMLYGSVTWTIAKTERRRIEAFEMWCFRRMLKISWTNMVSNEEVLERMSRRRNEWIGHVLRHGGLLGLIIEGCVEGKNARGRPRMEYMQQIIEDQGCTSYKETKRKASNREEWRIATNQSQD